MELGIADSEFIRSPGIPMTKQEIRVLTLVKAKIHPRDIVYDIGAGTGSLSIEAAFLASDGYVYSLERTSEGVDLIQKNVDKFDVQNISVMETEAPAGMEHLPNADVALIGGNGGRLDDILASLNTRLNPGGRIVLNCITLQTLMQCINYMRDHADSYSYEAIQLQATRLEQVGSYDMAKAVNPVYIVSCTKKA